MIDGCIMNFKNYNLSSNREIIDKYFTLIISDKYQEIPTDALIHIITILLLLN